MIAKGCKKNTQHIITVNVKLFVKIAPISSWVHFFLAHPVYKSMFYWPCEIMEASLSVPKRSKSICPKPSQTFQTILK